MYDLWSALRLWDVNDKSQSKSILFGIKLIPSHWTADIMSSDTSKGRRTIWNQYFMQILQLIQICFFPSFFIRFFLISELRKIVGNNLTVGNFSFAAVFNFISSYIECAINGMSTCVCTCVCATNDDDEIVQWKVQKKNVWQHQPTQHTLVCVCVILSVLMQFHKLLLDSDLNSSLKWCRNDFASRLQRCFFALWPTDSQAETECANGKANENENENEGKVFSFAKR